MTELQNYIEGYGFGISVKELASSNQRALLDKRVHVEGRIKSQSDSVFHNVDMVHEALRQKRKIQFMYFKYGTDLERHPRRSEPYVHTPVRIVFNDGFYYLITWSDRQEGFVTFRLDRIHLLQVIDEPATRNARIANYAFQDFEHKAFGMIDGRPETVTLHVSADGMDVVVDKFGRENLHVSNVTPEACDVHVPVLVSPQFHGWLAGLGGLLQLTGPQEAVAEYHAWLEKL